MNSISLKRINQTLLFKSKGFTLVEALVTVAIVVIVLSIGIPGFQTMIKNNQKTTAINDLRAALALARSTAITQRQRVTVCKSNNNEDCADSGDWRQGWIVFPDPNNPGTVDAGEQIIRVHDAVRGGTSFSGNTEDSIVSSRVSFSPEGMASGTLGTITYTDSRGEDYAGALVISFGGQVRYEGGSRTY